MSDAVTISSSPKPIVVPTCGIVLLSISSIVVAIRLYARLSRKVGSVGWDDSFLVLGWISGIALTIIAVYGALSRDFDDHIDEVPVEERQHAGYFGWLIEIFFSVALPSIKISIFLYFHQLARRIRNASLLWTVRFFICLLVIHLVTFTAFPFAICKPLEAQWKRLDPTWDESYACLDTGAATLVSGALDSLTDAVAVLIGFILVHQWDKPQRKKIGLYCLLSCGFSVLGAGIARVVLKYHLLTEKTRDWTWLGNMAILAALWECHLAICCACAPFVMPVLTSVGSNLSSASNSLRFMHGQSLNETKRLADSRTSSRSLKTKSFMTAQKSKPGPIDVEKAQVHYTQVSRPLPVAKPGSEMQERMSGNSDVGEITVVFTPSRNASHRRSRLEEDIHSPTIPPEHKYRLSALSWLSGSNRSRWSGLRSPGVEGRRGRTDGQTSSHHPKSIAISDIEADEFEDEVPPVPSTDPALNPNYVACRSCGQYHPYGFRHSTEEEESPNAVVALWRKRSKKNRSGPRQSVSTFFNDQDDEDEEDDIIQDKRLTQKRFR